MDGCCIAEGKKVSRDVNNMVTWTGVVGKKAPRDVNNMVTWMGLVSLVVDALC
jgi:hypothetical protein